MPDNSENKPQKRYHIDPNKVSKKDELRIKNWAHSIAKKHEHLLKPHKYQNNQIVATDALKPEDIDIQQIYPFQTGLHWILYKQGQYWALNLMSKRTLLANFVFAQI